MKREKFIEFWNAWVGLWYANAVVRTEGEAIPINTLCDIREKAGDDVFEMYRLIKRTAKEVYFKNPHVKRLNRYKRAAVIAYAVLQTNPLRYKYEMRFQIDQYYLKQRLAFMLALGSIIQDYEEEKIVALKSPIFQFESLGNSSNDVDGFLMSVYKDMLYSEAYGNYNILTWANVYCLLTERASSLSTLTALN